MKRIFAVLTLGLLLTACARTPAAVPTAPTVPTPAAGSTAAAAAPTEPASQYLIVIDPGHQARANLDREPVGPGATQSKYKVSGGTRGVATGTMEYRLNLQVALKLRQELEGRGYRVVLTRESHDVDMSNRERAELANGLQADAFLRIHANGSENPARQGAMTICQTPQNPYNGSLYPQSRALAQAVLDGMAARAGCRPERVWETDTMSGINWCAVPAVIVEIGYMSNAEEDRRLGQEDYQWKLVQGMADGLDLYFSGNSG